MKSKVLCLFSIVVFLLAGCRTTELEDTPTPIPSDYNTTVKLHSIHTKGPSSYDARVEEFNLGRLEYTTKAGKVMPFQLRGVIGIPEGNGSFPLVLITHGSHENKDASKRFDTGFEYLVETLAQNGYVAVSMDMSSAYLWKYGDNDDKEKTVHIASKHLEQLRLANDGQDVGYAANLRGKIDFSKIGLCGHSRGGEAIFTIAADQKEKGQDIRALLPIAPTIFDDEEKNDFPDSSISILIPELDGDVTSLDGLAIDETLSGSISSPHYATLLKNANHNFFNANLDGNDASLFYPKEDLTNQLNSTEQQNFLSHFAVDFYNASLKGKTEDTLYAPYAPAPSQMYNQEVSCRISKKSDITLLDTSMKDQLTLTDCHMSVLHDSWFHRDDEVLADTLTFGNDSFKKRALLNLRWEKLGAKLSFAPPNTYFRKHHVLSLRLITDPSDGLNENLKGQSLTVTLTDGAGNHSSATLGDSPNSLAVTPGKLDTTTIKDKNYSFWSHATPIMNTDIPLSVFKGVALDNITNVTISFDQTDRGGVFLERILLQTRDDMGE